jgi:hypothetical protein
MLLEEFFNQDTTGNQIVNYVYVSTLSHFIVNPNFQIFDNLLEEYERQENYLVCEGINKALQKIDVIYNDRFSEAIDKDDEDEEEEIFEFSLNDYVDHEERNIRVSRLIFEDIIKEIYEAQIKRYKESD